MGLERAVPENPLRFLLVTTFYPPFHFGGDALYVRQLAHALVARGHEVDVVHSVDAYLSLRPGRLPESCDEPAGLRVFALQAAFPRLSSLCTQQTGRPVWHSRALRSIFESRRYDVIHYHNISLVGGPDVLRLGDAIKLYTAHEHWLVCPTHVLWRHNRELCEEKQCLRCVLRHRRPPQLWRAAGLIQSRAKHVDQFIALSQFSAAKHREFGFHEPMRVMPSFISDASIDHTAGSDTGSDWRSSDGLSARVKDYLAQRQKSARPWFLFVGRLEKIKGVQDAIDVFLQDTGADLCVAGSGGYSAELIEQAGASAHIEFLGSVDQRSLSHLYLQARAVVLPSVCYEVFPLVAMEAFVHRTPIIARDLGPFREIIEHSGAGLLFKDRIEMRQAICELSGDPLKAHSMGEAAAAAFASTWSEDAAMRNYFSLLRELAQKRKAAPALHLLEQCDEDGALLQRRKSTPKPPAVSDH